MAVFKFNLTIALGLLAAVSVYALPGIPKGILCAADDIECKCHRLLRSPRNQTEGATEKAVKTCEDKFQTKVPTPQEGAPRYPPKLEGMTQEFKDCVRSNFLTNIGVMKNGVIDVAAMQAQYKEKINANKRADTTGTQVQKIVDAVPGCVTSNGGTAALNMRDFMTCTKNACVAALTA
ncbi:uncharacterized protein LOC135210078 isoform X2 [Macrobrachium nipponense]|uniref:uncharacterized protein LOC135210078 isoform X2 n=1 Tax=Macrobrachium nipponense TaxID=159736 RepID=UPI0030C7FFF8